MIRLAVVIVWQLFSSLATALCDRIEVKPKRVRKKIAKIFAAIPIIFAVCQMMQFNVVFFLLNNMQKHLTLVCIYILLIAVLAPVLAFFDKRKSSKAVKKGYIHRNLLFNLLGVASTWAMLYIAHKEITDFRFIEEFYVQEIIVMLIPACLGIVFAYQAIEQQNKKEEMDHAPSLKWKNQICNIVHLFNAYFFSLISAVFVVAYTLYCHIHHNPIYLNIGYLIFLLIALSFFYMCGFHKSRHVYLIFAIYVPVILVSSIYWMSWFTISKDMMRWQMMFIVFYSLLYALVVFRREGVLAVRRTADIHSNKLIKIKINWFYVAMLFIIAVSYMILWVVPLSVERISYNDAEKYVNAICKDTDKNADELLDEIRSRKWWDDENEDADYTQYLEFLHDHLGEELIEKGIITEEEELLLREKLDDWYNGLSWEYLENNLKK